MDQALKTTKSTEWRTPKAFLELVHAVAPIAYDPASQKDNPTNAYYWAYLGEAGQRINAARKAIIHWDVARWGSVGGMGGGLEADWSKAPGLIYCNPPYGAHLRGAKPDPFKKILRGGKEIGVGTGWAAKMAEHEGEGLYLVPSRTETAWWQRLYQWCDWCLLWSSPTLGSRLRFDDGKDCAPFPSSVFYRGPNVARFLSTFKAHGTMIPGERTKQVLIQAGLRSV